MALSDLKKNSARSPKRALSVDEFIAGAEHYAMGLPEPIHRLDTVHGGVDDGVDVGVDGGVDDSATRITGTAATFAAMPDAAKATAVAKPQPTAQPTTVTVSQHVTTVKLTHRLAPPSAKSLRAVSMKPEPMKHATFTLTAECITLLQELSQLHGTSKSALVRQLIQLASAEQAQTAHSSVELSPRAQPSLDASCALPSTLHSTAELPASVVKPLATNATYRTPGDRKSGGTDESQ